MIRFLFYIFLIYIGLTVASQVLFNRLAFLPPPPGYKQDKDIILIKTADRNTVASTILTVPGATYTILYSHGNATDIGYLQPYLKLFQEHGYNVLAYDYPGYGLSKGRPTEQNTYAAARAAYDFLVNDLKQSPESIILWGQSLGAAVAIDLATKVPCAGLVVESGFVSGFRTYTQIPLLPFDRYDNTKKITEIRCPLFVIHGQADITIPAWQGLSLYKKATVRKQYYFVPGANHNNVVSVAGIKYWDATADFIKMIQGAEPSNFPKPPSH